MRQIAMTAKIAQPSFARGWIILGLALGCWAMVIGAGIMASSLFSYIASAVFAA